jgi:hypothetical protein
MSLQDRLDAFKADFERNKAPRRGDAGRAAELARYRDRVLDIGSAPTIAYPKLADYDEHHVLRPTPRSRSA